LSKTDKLKPIPFNILTMKAIIRHILILCGIAVVAIPAHSQVPILNSYPNATTTLFLDFDGQYVTGTSWNWGGPINAQPAAISTSGIQEIFNRVAEDYRPFNINITTDSTVYRDAPANKRMRVIITSTSSWYGRAGGVAYVGSFAWGDDTPCWVFSSLLWDNTKWVAEAASHEAGHTLGLHHQSSFDAFCRKTAEYSGGQGEGEIGWAPIMGVGYYKNLTTWHNGPNTGGCNNLQSDIDIISSYVGYKPDDHSNRVESPTEVSIFGTAFNVSGLINRSGDTDAFRIMIPIPTNLKLNAIPQNVGSGNEGANIDIMIALLDAAKDTIGIYNPSALLSAGIDTNLNSGYYYMVVKGVGNVNQSDYGSIGYYSLSGQLANALPVHEFLLKGSVNSDKHSLTWSFVADEAIKEIVIESSYDGRVFSPVVAVSAMLRNFQYHPLASARYYRLKAVTVLQQRNYYSNTIQLYNGNAQPAQVMRSLVNDQLVVKSNGVNNYRIFDGSGKLLKSGNLANGLNTISLEAMPKGMLVIQFNNHHLTWNEKLVKY
jgi:hypothetical protein